MNSNIEPDHTPPDWSDGTWTWVRVPALTTPHPELVITPFVTDDTFTITHTASGLRVLDSPTVAEGIEMCRKLVDISFTNPGDPGSRQRTELATDVRRALQQ